MWLNGDDNLRALILHPQIHTDERARTDDICTGVVGGTVPLEIPGHGGLTPLSAV